MIKKQINDDKGMAHITTYANGHKFDEDSKRFVKRVKKKFMIRMLTYDLERLVIDFVASSDIKADTLPRDRLLYFDSEQEAKIYIMDHLYHFTENVLFEIVEIYL